MKRSLAPLLVVSLLAATLAFVGGARAANWCPDASVTVSPAYYTPGVPFIGDVTVRNVGTVALNLTRVAVRFSFESSDRVLSAVNTSVSSSGSESFQTPQVTPSSGGTSFTVIVKLDGYPSDNPSDSGQCTKTETVQTFNTTPIVTPLVNAALLALLAFVVVVVVVVIIVVVVVVAASKKTPAAPSYPPPYAPPPGSWPPQPPPQQPPAP